MKYTACTMFEGHYHYGLAVLINSLYRNNYRGDFYVGYRGDLPDWVIGNASFQEECSIHENAKSITIETNLRVIFVRLETKAHFTNYKPDFLLDVITFENYKSDATFYIDPDIVIYENWRIFLEWSQSGIAVSEDVNSPVHNFHPKRVNWRKIYSKEGYRLTFKNSVYVNGGFIGLSKNDYRFLKLWKEVQEIMSSYIGGLDKVGIGNKNLLDNKALGDYSPFGKTDQDALNISLEIYEGNISYIGKEGMSFGPGPRLMSHALGAKKPWVFKPLKEVLNGVPPRIVDKDFWENATFPINVYDASFVKSKKNKIKIASLIGRFYKRN